MSSTDRAAPGAHRARSRRNSAPARSTPPLRENPDRLRPRAPKKRSARPICVNRAGAFRQPSRAPAWRVRSSRPRASAARARIVLHVLFVRLAVPLRVAAGLSAPIVARNIVLAARLLVVRLILRLGLVIVFGLSLVVVAARAVVARDA